MKTNTKTDQLGQAESGMIASLQRAIEDPRLGGSDPSYRLALEYAIKVVKLETSIVRESL